MLIEVSIGEFDGSGIVGMDVVNMRQKNSLWGGDVR
jgi:hypothetical protein